MKGLILNQYYSVYKGVLLYGIIGAAIAISLMLAQIEAVESFVTFIPTIFLVLPAMEVLKHESMSGWNKFSLTLPVNRKQIVQSHYLFFTSLLFIGIIVTLALSLLSGIILNQSMSIDIVAFSSVLNGIGVALILGVVCYPLTYAFGSEKADAILIFGTLAAFGLYLLSAWIYGSALDNLSLGFLTNTHPDLMFALLFVGISLILFFISYFLAFQTYKRKEF